jgi:hypothetical protein
MTNLEKLLAQLPPDLQKEVEDFAADLAKNNRKSRPGRLKLDWVGSLSDLGGKYSAAELQQTALREWGD